MLYLLNKDVRTVRWNGEPLHEATSAIVKETMNGDFTLTVKYPISDSGIYQLIQEDMLIKAPTPVLGAQLFRIKKPVEHNDHLEITAYHISDDVMQRSITPMSVTSQSCGMALSRMVQNTKTALGDFSFNSDIQDRRTFNTTETETLYSVLLDGKHSIVGTWEGELVRDNFALTLKKRRGENRGVVITTHKNLKDYQRTRNSQNVVTRIHAKSTFKPEGSEKETTFRVTVDSPLINSYPYINEKEYENNNAKSVEELQKWAQSKFSNDGIDKVSDAIKIEAYELDGQVVHMGDTVNLKSWKHNVDAFKKAIAYEFDALKEEYISLTFDDKAGIGGSRTSGGLSSAADAILGVTGTAQEIALEKALQNADLGFDHQAGLLRQEILDGIELARAKAEEVKRELSDTINQRFDSFDNASIQEAKRRAEEALRNAGASSLLAQEAKNISERARTDITNLQASSQNALSQIEAFKTEYGTKLNEVKSTADGLFTKMGVIETYISKDGQRQESLQRYARDESARQVSAVREQISRDYVGKSTYQEDVRGLERRFSAISTQTNNDIASKIARYKQTVDGQFASITSQMAGKVNQTDFQRVRETSQLYERIIGSNENDISNKVARMALTSQLFQVEVAKNFGDNRNYVKNADFREKSKSWQETNVSGLNFNYGHSITQRGKSGVHIYGSAGTMEFYGIYQTFKFEGSKNDNVILSFLASKDGADDFSGIRIGIHCRKNNAIISQMWRTIQNSEIARFSYKKISLAFNLPVDVDEINLMFYGEQNKVINLYISEIKFEKGSNATSFTLAPEDTEEAVRTVQSQLAGSYAIQNLNSAGDLISGINLGANGHNRLDGKLTHITGETLIDNAVIKSAMIDKLKTANFEAGSVTSTIIDTEAVTADKVRMNQAFANKLVASNIFTDTLAAKEAFINKLRSVVVTATLLEGYKGKIGGFQIGTHEKDSSVYWITGQNQFSVGMSNGSGQWNQTALWVNWGNDWMKPSNTAWFVKNTGQMFCYNRAEFWSTPIIHGDLQVTGHIFYNNKNSGKSGYWIHSSKYSNFEPSDNYLYLYYSGSGYDWIPMNKEISDLRYKHNIEDSTVSGLDVIQKLKTYSYRKEYDGQIENISCGIMAQDVQKYIPEAFYENPDGAYSYRTFELVPYLIKAIQELNQKLEEIA